MGVRDRDRGTSESRSVMERIRAFNVARPVGGAHLRVVPDRESLRRTDFGQERK